MAKAVKLADIAQRVGVSTVTVSKALSDQKGVSEELREKIKQLAAEMGYRPPSSGKHAGLQKQYTIGVLIQEIFLEEHASYYWKLYQELTKKAVSRGCFTVLEIVSRRDVLASKMPVMLQEGRVNGVVVIGSMEKPYLLELERRVGVPIVYMDYYDNERSIDTVIPNSFYGSYMLTNYLFDMGHRKIAYLGTLCATNSITDRYLGYVKSLLEHGVSLRSDWVFDDRDSDGIVDLERMLVLPGELPTAFVCNCDVSASYLVKYLTKRGCRVPDDVSVVGFDNYLYPGICDIGITTYEVDIGEMARRTLHKIVKKIANESYTAGAFIVDGHPVYKDSVIRLQPLAAEP